MNIRYCTVENRHLSEVKMASNPVQESELDQDQDQTNNSSETMRNDELEQIS